MPNNSLPAGTFLEVTDEQAKDGEPFITCEFILHNCPGDDQDIKADPGDRLIRIHPPGTLPVLTKEMIEVVNSTINWLLSGGPTEGELRQANKLRAAFASVLKPPAPEKLDDVTQAINDAIRCRDINEGQRVIFERLRQRIDAIEKAGRG